MRHLTPADYTAMPWANGRGQTIEMLRVDDAAGRMRWRLSMATVAEEGPFSLFPGMQRNLTVIEGPGFDLVGDATLRADPLVPVAFPGDIRLAAANVPSPSVDFNVIADTALTVEVQVRETGLAEGQTLCCFALGPAQVGDRRLGRHDLLVGTGPLAVNGGPVLVVRIGGAG